MGSGVIPFLQRFVLSYLLLNIFHYNVLMML